MAGLFGALVVGTLAVGSDPRFAYAQDEPPPGGGQPKDPIILIEWKWDEGMPKLEKTGKKLGDKDEYKLTATGKLIFADDQGTVNGDESRMWMYVGSTLTPNVFPAEPSQKFKVSVGAKTKLSATSNRHYYAITAIATVDGTAGGAPYPILTGQRVKVVPYLAYKLTPTSSETKSHFDPPGYANAE
jgi:hypothetical protein